LYLINKAKEEIKDLNQQMLYQKAELKKSYLKKVNDNSIRIKTQFGEAYNNFLNKSLASNLIQAKQSILNLKNKVLEDLKSEFLNHLRENISKNYSNYLKFLIESIRSSTQFIDKPPKVILLLNQRDFRTMAKNSSTIKEIFKNEVEILSSEEEFIGGFKAIIEDDKISYNYSIDNLLAKNMIIIEEQIAKIFSETETEKLQQEFEKFIKNKKQEMKEYLKEYEQIG